MNKLSKIFYPIMTFIVAATAPGCAATGQVPGENETVRIEQISSRVAKLTRVSVIQEGPDVILRGELKRRWAGRGPIPGHVDIDITGPDGIIIDEASIDYHQHGVKTRAAEFVIRVEKDLPVGSVIRVTHHLKNHSK